MTLAFHDQVTPPHIHILSYPKNINTNRIRLEFLVIRLHLAEVFQLQHLDISRMVELDHALLRVNREQLPGLLLVLVPQDHLHLVPPAGNHRSKMVCSNVHSPYKRV